MAMTDLRLYNSLTRKKEAFEPIDPNHVRMYVCGPTVYSYAHIGNARPAIVFDTLRSVLEALYPRVTHVANITDIEDKIIEAANKAGQPISAITEKYARIYNEDMASVGVRAPHIQPKATDHVDGMITMIEALIANGHAYENDGHVLFNVPSYAAYGRLSGRGRDEQIAGARVEVAPYKKDPADFVLWKPSNADQPGWESPWGRGRPGWHIECSVMAKAFLGDVFDIHGGGLDLTFPHHENEIAQSCCANNQDTFAKYWIHNGFVTVEGEKMSKSLGNVLLVHDMIADGTPGEAMRFNMLSTHYRQPLNWTQDGLKQSIKTLDKWYDIIATVSQDNTVAPSVMDALCDDLNTPLVISYLHYIAKETPQFLQASAQMLGLLKNTADKWQEVRKSQVPQIDEDKVNALVAARQQARTDKDFTRADKIRDELLALGITVEDSANGPIWHIAS